MALPPASPGGAEGRPKVLHWIPSKDAEKPGISLSTAAIETLAMRKLYNRPDPLRLYSNPWLMSGERVEFVPVKSFYTDKELKHLPPADVEAYEDMQRWKEAKAWEEKVESQRKEALAAGSSAHVLWLRGRETRCDLVVQGGESPAATAGADAPPETPPVGKKPPRDVWWRVALPAPIDEAICFRSDFVEEARAAAFSEQMPLATIDTERAGLAVQKTPKMRRALRRHCLAISSDGRREFWSRTFTQLVQALRIKFHLEEVEVTEKRLSELAPDVTFDVEGESIRPPPVPKPVQLTVPKALQRRVPQPSLPPFPERLPCKVPYTSGEPWSNVLRAQPIMLSDCADLGAGTGSSWAFQEEPGLAADLSWS